MPDRHVLVRPLRRRGVRRQPAAVARLVQVTGVVERDRLEEHRHGAVHGGGGQAGAQHRRRVLRPGRHGDHQAGDVAQHADSVVVVEVPAEPLLVGEAGHPDHQRVAVLPGGEELQARRLAAQLVLGVVQVGEVLDLRHGQQAGHARAEAEAEDRLLVEERVEDPPGAEPPRQSPGDAVHAALAAHVLAEGEQPGMGRERVRERPVDGVGEGERPAVLGQPAAEGVRALAAAPPPWPPARRPGPGGAARAAR